MRIGKLINIFKHKARLFKRYLLFFVSILKDKKQRKYAFKWVLSLKKNYLLNKPSPWLTFGAIDYLDFYLKTRLSVKVFEYGSGGSTLYWLSKGASCVSIEHDSGWFKLLNSKIGKEENLKYRLVLPGKIAPLKKDEWDYTNPLLYLTSETNDLSYKDYVQQIEAFPDNYFDIVLIDGRARPSCLYQSFTKVKPNGLIILDNADREYYLSNTSQYLKNFKRIDFYSVAPTQDANSLTSIFQKQSDSFFK